MEGKRYEGRWQHGNEMLGSQAWWQILIVILALERLKQEDGCEMLKQPGLHSNYQASHGYIARSYLKNK